MIELRVTVGNFDDVIAHIGTVKDKALDTDELCHYAVKVKHSLGTHRRLKSDNLPKVGSHGDRLTPRRTAGDRIPQRFSVGPCSDIQAVARIQNTCPLANGLE